MSDSLEAGGWRVEFFRRLDRVAHRIFRQTASGWTLLAESLEGTPDEAWPPSPPFQQVHFERREDGPPVALLVGMAGRSHWSASVEFGGEASEPRWDVACRTADAPEWLGSKYRLAVPAETIGTRVRLQVGEQGALGILRDGDGAPLPATLSGNELHWRAPADIALGARTIRWQYAFGVEPPRSA